MCGQAFLFEIILADIMQTKNIALLMPPGDYGRS